jgi:PhoPQ-activated pathogenicity-related protein
MLTAVASRVTTSTYSHFSGMETEADDYIAKPDSSYAWKLIKTGKGPGFTAYLVDLTSQTWRTTEEVNRPLWKHWLIVIRPDKVKYDTAFLVIAGGGNGGDPPDPTKSPAAMIATATNSVTAELKMIPNQPLIFCNDGKQRSEDDLIAYTWDKYMTTGDPTWLARFPMVKSAVRAMDTIEALLASDEGGKVKVDKFVVGGASKRGWTTWLAGAVDKRVVAIVPIVIDVLNCVKSLAHHYAAYGFWAPAIDDYENHKILARLDSPELANLFKLVDPYSYRHRLTMPKYIVTASGDQFFLPDSSQFYFDELQGEKYLGTVPNVDHGAKNRDVIMSIVAFYRSILDGKPRPQFNWQFESEGAVRIQCKQQPLKATLWTATNPEARDFRVESLGRKYKATVLQNNGGEYLAKVEKPAKGWTAYFVELTYLLDGRPWKVTTPVRVIPDTCPFADKIIPGTKMKAGG